MQAACPQHHQLLSPQVPVHPGPFCRFSVLFSPKMGVEVGAKKRTFLLDFLFIQFT